MDTESRKCLAELVSAASYGSVLTLAALSAIGVSDVARGHGSELVAGIGLGTWIAHVFAELLGGHVRHDEPLGRAQVVHAVVDGSPILASTVLPALVLTLGRLDVVAEDTARLVAILVGILQLLALGAFVARVTAAPLRDSWVFAVATAVVGTSVVVVEVALGH